MVEQKFFMHRIKHDKSKDGSDAWDKGIEVKDSFEAAKQSYHAYLGAYAYGKTDSVDFVQCGITNVVGGDKFILEETWIAPEETAEPEA